MSTLGFGIWIWVDMCPHDVIRWQVATMTSSWCQIILVPLLPLVESSLYDLRNNERIDAMDDIVAPDNGVGIHHSNESDLEPVSRRPELQKISRQGSEEARRRRPLFLPWPAGEWHECRSISAGASSSRPREETSWSSPMPALRSRNFGAQKWSHCGGSLPLPVSATSRPSLLDLLNLYMAIAASPLIQSRWRNQ